MAEPRRQEQFVDALKLFSTLPSQRSRCDIIGHCYNASPHTHSQMTERELAESGIKHGTVRLSIGIEHIDDLLMTLEQAV